MASWLAGRGGADDCWASAIYMDVFKTSQVYFSANMQRQAISDAMTKVHTPSAVLEHMGSSDRCGR